MAIMKRVGNGIALAALAVFVLSSSALAAGGMIGGIYYDPNALTPAERAEKIESLADFGTGFVTSNPGVAPGSTPGSFQQDLYERWLAAKHIVEQANSGAVISGYTDKSAAQAELARAAQAEMERLKPYRHFFDPASSSMIAAYGGTPPWYATATANHTAFVNECSVTTSTGEPNVFPVSIALTVGAYYVSGERMTIYGGKLSLLNGISTGGPAGGVMSGFKSFMDRAAVSAENDGTQYASAGATVTLYRRETVVTKPAWTENIPAGPSTITVAAHTRDGHAVSSYTRTNPHPRAAQTINHPARTRTVRVREVLTADEVMARCNSALAAGEPVLGWLDEYTNKSGTMDRGSVNMADGSVVPLELDKKDVLILAAKAARMLKGSRRQATGQDADALMALLLSRNTARVAALMLARDAGEAEVVASGACGTPAGVVSGTVSSDALAAHAAARRYSASVGATHDNIDRLAVAGISTPKLLNAYSVDYFSDGRASVVCFEFDRPMDEELSSVAEAIAVHGSDALTPLSRRAVAGSNERQLYARLSGGGLPGDARAVFAVLRPDLLCDYSGTAMELRGGRNVSYAYDHVAPSVVGVTLQDGDGDGKAETAVLRLNELVAGWTVVAERFTVGGQPCTSASARANEISVSRAGVTDLYGRDLEWGANAVRDSAMNEIAASR